MQRSTINGRPPAASFSTQNSSIASGLHVLPPHIQHNQRQQQQRCQQRRGGGRFCGAATSRVVAARATPTPAAAADGLNPSKLDFAAAAAARAPPPEPPPVTKSDADFAALGVEFVAGREGVDVSELNALFERVGFPRRDPARLAVALEHSSAVVWVRATKSSRVAKAGQMVGFARATGDGALTATIWEVAVAPAWQRSGLGRGLVERLTAELVAGGVAFVSLYAEAKVVGMYRKLGFAADVNGVKGMAFQRGGGGGGGAAARGGLLAAAGGRRW